MLKFISVASVFVAFAVLTYANTIPLDVTSPIIINVKECWDKYQPICVCLAGNCQTINHLCVLQQAVDGNEQSFDIIVPGECLGGQPEVTRAEIIEDTKPDLVKNQDPIELKGPEVELKAIDAIQQLDDD